MVSYFQSFARICTLKCYVLYFNIFLVIILKKMPNLMDVYKILCARQCNYLSPQDSLVIGMLCILKLELTSTAAVISVGC